MSAGAGPVRLRNVLARIGVTALNLLAPGLGLFRLGAWRPALLFMALPSLFMVPVGVGLRYVWIGSVAGALLAVTCLGALTVVNILGPMVLTWRRSAYRNESGRWTRWYVVVALWLIFVTASNLTRATIWQVTRPFYAPSQSMAPTIDQNDKFIADMWWRGPLHRGDVVLLKTPTVFRVSRIVGLPGDRVAVRDGVPVINAVPAVQRQFGRTSFASAGGPLPATLVLEHLPGEAGDHRVLRMEPTFLDDMAPMTVPPGRLFLLSDNRDCAADSRLRPDQGGLGLVPLSAIAGRPIYIHWSPDRARIGIKLAR